MCSKTRFVEERGAGTILTLAIVAAILGLGVLMMNLSNRFVEQARLDALADNASVAAADSLRGLVAGYPCEVAKSIAPITSCVIIGNDVLVEVARNGVVSRSRAGEPG